MKYKVGDIIRVRDWDDMERQYGTDSDGDIRLPDGWWFKNSMKPFCGKDYKISKVFVTSYLLEDTDDYHFTDDMLVPAEARNDKGIKIDLCKILGVKPDQVFYLSVLDSYDVDKDQYKVHENVLQRFSQYAREWQESHLEVNDLKQCKVVLRSATEDEKTILRSLDEKYRKKGNIYRLTTEKLRIVVRTECYEDFYFPYSDLFQFIQQGDNYGVPIKDIIGE